MACNRKMIMRSASANKPHMYDLGENRFQIMGINCNSTAPVSLQLLAIEEKRKRDHTDKCEYDKNKKAAKYCIIDPESFAHVYVTKNNKSAAIQHYIILFIERRNIENYNGLAKILLDTIKWLKIKIKNERTQFNLFFFGCLEKQTAAAVCTDYVSQKINIELKRRLRKEKQMYFKDAESICNTKSVRKDAKMFTIFPNSSGDPYKFNVS